MKQIKILKALADENRIRILNLLNKKEMCVCEIEHILGISQSNASGHLAKLNEAEIITSERQGHYIFYKINPSILDEFVFLKELIVHDLNKTPFLQNDLAQLDLLEKQGMLCRRDSCCLDEKSGKEEG